MKYLLMMSLPSGETEYPIYSWPEKDIQAHVAYWQELNQSLRDAGEFVTVEGLMGPDQARLVRAGKDGTPITDGVFPESKEFLAGFWIIDVESADRAYAIAARASAAPGPGGKPLNMSLEVREVMAGPQRELP